MLDGIYQWFLIAIETVWSWVWDQLWLFVEGSYAFLETLPQLIWQFGSSLLDLVGVDVAFPAVEELFEVLAYILPINALLGLAVVNITAVVTIRVVRWTLALIPTIGG